MPAYPTDLIRLLRDLRTQARRAGGDWRPVVDALRPFTADLWQGMSALDRRRFLRHLRPWWDIHRHRMAPAVADRIDGARASGQLRLRAGRIRAYRETEGGVEVTYRARGEDTLATVAAVRVVNCSGAACDYGRVAHPLVQDLLRTGEVRPDPLRLGLDVTASGAVMRQDGAISRRVFAVGPVTRGSVWEMTAVPDIRRQAELLATHLAALVRPARGPAFTDHRPAAAD